MGRRCRLVSSCARKASSRRTPVAAQDEAAAVEGFCTVFGFCYLFVWGYIADLSMVPRLRRGRLASRALRTPFISCAVKRIPKSHGALSGAGNRTAASGVAWSGCASLRGPLCAGEALLEARTQASVALFKLGAHSATLRPEFGGPKSLRCCCAKGVGHRAQLMLRARRGDGKNNHPVPLLRTPTPQSSLSPAPRSGGSQLPSS